MHLPSVSHQISDAPAGAGGNGGIQPCATGIRAQHGTGIAERRFCAEGETASEEAEETDGDGDDEVIFVVGDTGAKAQKDNETNTKYYEYQAMVGGEIVKTLVGAMPKPKLLRELEPFLG
mgnify:CR=1 FL=1